MAGEYASINDRDHDLLKKITNNTADTEVNIGDVTVDLGQLETSIGATNEAAAATDTATSGLNGLIKRLLQKVTAFTGVAGSSSSSSVVGVQGHGYKGTSTLTRASNTTPYSIGDVVGGVGTIATAGPVSGDVLLTSIRILYNVSALPSGLANMTMHFYGATPPSAIADNSPFTLGSGDRSAYIGHVDNIPFAALGVGTQTVQGQIDNIIQQFLCDGSGQLFFYLVTNQAFTPAANSETLSVVTRGLLP